MALVVRCPHCRSVLTIASHLVDRSVRCSRCARSFRSRRPARALAATPAPIRRPPAFLPAAPPPAAAPRGNRLSEPVPAPPRRRFLALAGVLVLLGALGGVGYLGWQRFAPKKETPAGPAPAPAAQEAERYGGIEIGSNGIKVTVIDKFKDPELGFDFNVLFEQEANTQIVTGMANTGRFDVEALKDSVAAVKRFYELLRNEHKVPAERIFLVGSSGLFGVLKDKPDLIRTAQRELSAAVFDAVGKKPDFIDADREVELSIAGAVPRKYAESSLYIDVGGGNAKGGYREASGRFVTWSAPFGSRTFYDRVRKAAQEERVPVAKKAADLRENLIVPELRKQIDRRPGLVNRERVYLSGGIVWATATLMRPADRRPYVEMVPEDFDELNRRLAQNPGALPLPPLNGLGDESLRNAVQADLKKIGDLFKPEQVLAATEIVRACTTEFGLDRPGRKVYFVRNGKIAWLLAYMIEGGNP
jgi:hypothetical protein